MPRTSYRNSLAIELETVVSNLWYSDDDMILHAGGPEPFVSQWRSSPEARSIASTDSLMYTPPIEASGYSTPNSPEIFPASVPCQEHNTPCQEHNSTLAVFLTPPPTPPQMATGPQALSHLVPTVALSTKLLCTFMHRCVRE